MPAVSRKPLDESTIGQAEEDAASEVRKIVQSLEKAVDAWEKAGHEPKELAPDFARYGSLLRQLKEWESAPPKAGAPFEARLARLRSLSELRKGF